MPHTIAICTHKGGTGKTVTALSLAAGLANTGQRCLLIDLDPQGHTTIGLGVEIQGLSLKEFFEQHPSLPLCDVIQRAPNTKNLDVLPADLRLAWTAEGLSGRPRKEELLKRSLKQVTADYDWILIDTPPSLGVLTQNALTAADFLVIPTIPEARATNAILDLLELVQLLKGESFDAYGILLTRVDGRKSRTNHAVFAALAPWKTKLLQTVIPQCESLNQAQMAGQDIFRFDPKSTGAEAYRQLQQEMMHL